ncbi:Endonuclease/exonuclease/phosphatase [Aspergillus bertholletiae]|uniref:Endonuclease/exonuclease/phosphatase n=1 Tax=Aspergillus bertholletiae TaxID=1226010 RepID=A0A5N7B7L9_9EURO|nr:Endonuclease/exonuclease/phosphatase [Aspergillus bertholletiae]
MDFYARVRTSLLFWTHEIPLPPVDAKSFPKLQSRHYFHHSLQQWAPVSNDDTREHAQPLRDNDGLSPSDLVLLTWNIDAASARTEDRVTETITFITHLNPTVHIVFLQEVPRAALEQILKDERIRGSWFSSKRDDTAWGKQSFATMTLLSKTCFALAALGPIWRVAYPSHFGRDALCCDLFPLPNRRRIRLVNVHLDSLRIQPSHRPQQISIVSSFLRSASHGLVAGDFNSVLEEDATLLERSGLTDVWTALHPNDSGYTWGTDGEQLFPPNRMDKVAMIGLDPHSIKIHWSHTD